MKRKIDFLIIGAPKAGTTALSDFLRMHPGIFFPTREVLFFSSDEYYQQGDKYLDFLFSDVKEERVIGGRSGLLLFLHDRAERVYEYNPNMKLIAMLRNPVDRAYSAFWYARRVGWEPCLTFEEALGKEQERAKGTPRERAMSYLAHGHYSEHLAHYIDRFGRDNVRVIMNEDFKLTPAKTLAATLEWLGLRADLQGIDLRRRVNVGLVPRWTGIQRFMFDEGRKLVRLVRRLMNPTFSEALFFRVTQLFIILNTRKNMKYPSLKPDVRAQLIEHFKPWNKQLSSLLDVDLDHWNQ